MVKPVFLCITLAIILLIPVLLNLDRILTPMPEQPTIQKIKTVTSEKSCFSPALSDNPIPSLAAVASLPPPDPPNTTCSPPRLPLQPTCSDSAFTGQLLPHPRKIVHMILFAFEVCLIVLIEHVTCAYQVDTLEIHLRETSSYVTHYFLVEATLTHKGESKPILWDRIRSLLHKIIFYL